MVGQWKQSTISKQCNRRCNLSPARQSSSTPVNQLTSIISWRPAAAPPPAIHSSTDAFQRRRIHWRQIKDGNGVGHPSLSRPSIRVTHCAKLHLSFSILSVLCVRYVFCFHCFLLFSCYYVYDFYNKKAL